MRTSLVNIDRTYGHLNRDSHHRAIALLDGGVDAGGRFVDAVAPTTTARNGSETSVSSTFGESPLPDSNRRPLPYHGSALPTELRGRYAGALGVLPSPPRGGPVSATRKRHTPAEFLRRRRVAPRGARRGHTAFRRRPSAGGA